MAMWMQVPANMKMKGTVEETKVEHMQAPRLCIRESTRQLHNCKYEQVARQAVQEREREKKG